MKGILLLLIVLALLVLIPWTIRAEAVLPLGNAEWSFLYDRLEQQEAVTLSTDDYQLGPYWLDLTTGQLGPFAWLGEMQPRDLDRKSVV